jgi:hypothetical protein
MKFAKCPVKFSGTVNKFAEMANEDDSTARLNFRLIPDCVDFWDTQH